MEFGVYDGRTTHKGKGKKVTVALQNYPYIPKFRGNYLSLVGRRPSKMNSWKLFITKGKRNSYRTNVIENKLRWLLSLIEKRVAPNWFINNFETKARKNLWVNEKESYM